MLQMIVYYLIEKFCSEEKEINDSIFLPYDISGLWKPFWETPSNKMKITKLIQWNDNWLLTILQKIYLEMFMDNDSEVKNSQLYYFLEEII